MAVARTLAYYDTAAITAVKSFILQVPGLNQNQFQPLSKESKIEVILHKRKGL